MKQKRNAPQEEKIAQKRRTTRKAQNLCEVD